jgi:hypothetical protein
MNTMWQAYGRVKPKVFTSYHHHNDQAYQDHFVRLFADNYELFTDTSLERRLDSDNTGYIDRAIRENNITGSSITVVLCGAETWKRKYVDWEIHATLDKQHALLGIILPTNAGQFVPNRLHDNIQSGYAHWITWTTDPSAVEAAITQALTRAERTGLIRNEREQMTRNIT